MIHGYKNAFGKQKEVSLVQIKQTQNSRLNRGEKEKSTKRYLNEPIPASFSLSVSFPNQLTDSFENFCQRWTRTVDLWCRKQLPVSQLDHSHCPIVASRNPSNIPSIYYHYPILLNLIDQRRTGESKMARLLIRKRRVKLSLIIPNAETWTDV